MHIKNFIRFVSLLFASQMTSVEKGIINEVGNSLEGEVKHVFEKQVKAIVGVKRNSDGREVYFLFSKLLSAEKSTLPRFSFDDTEIKLATVDLEYCKASFKVDVWIVKNCLFSIEYSRLPDAVNECLDFCIRKVDVHINP